MIIPEIISFHFEEASFLWLLRDRFVLQPNYNLGNLVNLDERIEAHIDGLRVAGDAGWKIIAQGLEEAEAGGVFTAAVLAFESLNTDRMERVMEVGIARPELWRGLVSAFGWLSLEQAQPLIDSLLSHESAVARVIGIAASAIHRRDPGAELFKALQDHDPVLKTRAARAAGELGRDDLIPLLQKHIKADDDKCRFYAAWSGTLLKLDDALKILRKFAVPENPYAEEAVQVAAKGMDLSSAQSWQKELAGDIKTLRLAIICAGAAGNPVCIPWLISNMETPELARVAGESFEMITGADIEFEKFNLRVVY